jgi:hypothetical protein
LGLPPFSFPQSAANGHAAQASDFRHLPDATVPMLPCQYPGEQSPTPFIQFDHHAIDGPMVCDQLNIPT